MLRIAQTDESISERLKAIGRIGPLFKMLWETSPFLLCVTSILRLIRAILPTLLLWTGKRILDCVVMISRGRGDLEQTWKLVATECCLYMLLDSLSYANNFTDTVLGEEFTTFVTMKLMRHSASLDLSVFENPLFYDKLERVRGQASGRMMLLTSALNSAQELSTLVSLASVLFVRSPWIVVLLLMSTIPSAIGELRYAKQNYAALFRRTPQRRKMEYLRLLASWSDSAKEVRLFGLIPYLLERYAALAHDIQAESKRITGDRTKTSIALGVASAVFYYCAYAIVLNGVCRRAISIGSFAFLVSSLSRCRLSSQRIFGKLNGISEQALLLQELVQFFEIKSDVAAPKMPASIPSTLSKGIELRDVGFSYPGTDRFAVRHLNLTIGPTEKLALIGLNGAGKSTVVKLLTRLYDPTEGQILFEGLDIRSFDIEEYRELISASFQDFMRYDLPVRENVGVGKRISINDDRAIWKALIQCGAGSLIEGTPNKLDQMLGRRYKDGTDLSGGEWQKVATARACVRDAALYIFDEPTASLDATSEQMFFDRFRTITDGKMALVISHRMATIRITDKIVVLSEGKILEQGSHETLIALDGCYANLYRLQAKAFQKDEDMISLSERGLFPDQEEFPPRFATFPNHNEQDA